MNLQQDHKQKKKNQEQSWVSKNFEIKVYNKAAVIKTWLFIKRQQNSQLQQTCSEYLILKTHPLLKDDTLNIIVSDSNLRAPVDAWEPVLHNG